MNLEQKIKKLQQDCKESIIRDPVNETQEGFNLALQLVSSKISFILGNVRVYKTKEELLKILNK